MTDETNQYLRQWFLERGEEQAPRGRAIPAYQCTKDGTRGGCAGASGSCGTPLGHRSLWTGCASSTEHLFYETAIPGGNGPLR